MKDESEQTTGIVMLVGVLGFGLLSIVAIMVGKFDNISRMTGLSPVELITYQIKGMVAAFMQSPGPGTHVFKAAFLDYLIGTIEQMWPVLVLVVGAIITATVIRNRKKEGNYI